MLNTKGYPRSEASMTLFELLGDDPPPFTTEERKFLEQASALWSRQFNKIVLETTPVIKTRIIVKKKRNNG